MSIVLDAPTRTARAGNGEWIRPLTKFQLAFLDIVLVQPGRRCAYGALQDLLTSRGHYAWAPTTRKNLTNLERHVDMLRGKLHGTGVSVVFERRDDDLELSAWTVVIP